MIKRIVIVLLALAVILGGIFGIKAYQFRMMQAQFAQPMPPAVISATEAREEQWQPRLQAAGSLVALNGTDVTTEIGGIVSAIRFESGQAVKAGDVLLQLEATVDKAALEGARAERRLAEVQLERAKDLIKRNAISSSDYDAAKASFDAAEARMAEKAAKLAQKTIRAPFDGLLGIRGVNLGEYLSPGTRIVSLQALDPIYVDYALPERHLRELAPGQAVEVRVAAYPEQVFRGSLQAVESGVDRRTRSIALRAILDNSAGLLRPGMFADVATVLPTVDTVITVPQTAISFNTYGNFLYVIEKAEGGKLLAKRRQVETGRSHEGRIVVSKGLKAGEQVVRAGLVKLRDGMPVAIDNQVELNDGEVRQE
ncbi:efflux RND transporter periplasmic adaptor subunit [Sulfurivermis fontis]|uniref:efflux RND transporter periplasmic adaptor subunit n=1 Tax=Sulfurivermis fontis TaxID=1972068 RepID=UPI000FDC2F05|nr:efflux RND transporter periplasmic adaptor subunit [Sulfurivermis fontis]